MTEASLPDGPLAECVFAALDFESAGYRPGVPEEPVQVGIARMRGWNLLPEDALRSYLQPTGEVTWAASRVHGIERRQLEGAPRALDLWTPIRERLEGAVVVAHGVGTEKRFLRVFPSHGFGPWLDTLALSRRCHPELESHRLGDLVGTFRLEDEVGAHCPGLRWHDAYYDAVASLVLLRHLVRTAGLETLRLRDFLERL